MQNSSEISTAQVQSAVYTESKGIGILSTLLFAVIVTVLMVVIAHIKGC